MCEPTLLYTSSGLTKKARRESEKEMSGRNNNDDEDEGNRGDGNGNEKHNFEERIWMTIRLVRRLLKSWKYWIDTQQQQQQQQPSFSTSDTSNTTTSTNSTGFRKRMMDSNASPSSSSSSSSSLLLLHHQSTIWIQQFLNLAMNLVSTLYSLIMSEPYSYSYSSTMKTTTSFDSFIHKTGDEKEGEKKEGKEWEKKDTKRVKVNMKYFKWVLEIFLYLMECITIAKSISKRSESLPTTTSATPTPTTTSSSSASSLLSSCSNWKFFLSHDCLIQLETILIQFDIPIMDEEPFSSVSSSSSSLLSLLKNQYDWIFSQENHLYYGFSFSHHDRTSHSHTNGSHDTTSTTTSLIDEDEDEEEEIMMNGDSNNNESHGVDNSNNDGGEGLDRKMMKKRIERDTRMEEIRFIARAFQWIQQQFELRRKKGKNGNEFE